jgi:hypothetical protein
LRYWPLGCTSITSRLLMSSALSRPVVSTWYEYIVFSLLCVISLMCSLNLVLKFLPVWPRYMLEQLPYFNLYTPHFSNKSLFSLLQIAFVRYLPRVLEVLKAILILYFFKHLVIDCTLAPLYVNKVHFHDLFSWLLLAIKGFLVFLFILSIMLMWWKPFKF